MRGAYGLLDPFSAISCKQSEMLKPKCSKDNKGPLQVRWAKLSSPNLVSLVKVLHDPQKSKYYYQEDEYPLPSIVEILL
jgi:hypothetical protein